MHLFSDILPQLPTPVPISTVRGQLHRKELTPI